MTRIERMRNMDVKEIAEAIGKFGYGGDAIMERICKENGDCPYMDDEGEMSAECDCIPCVVKWLESEVEK